MGLLAGFFALGGLLGGLSLIVVWASSLERWMERETDATERLEVEMHPAEPRLREVAANPAAIAPVPDPQGTEAEPAASPAAA